MTWTSSNESIATVTSIGNGQARVQGVGIGSATLGADVTITAVCDGVTKSCLFTIYETLPTITELYTIKGGCGGKVSGSSSILAIFKSASDDGLDNSVRCDSTSLQPGINSSLYTSRYYGVGGVKLQLNASYPNVQADMVQYTATGVLDYLATVAVNVSSVSSIAKSGSSSYVNDSSVAVTTTSRSEIYTNVTVLLFHSWQKK